jgi:hypothetical protein
MLQGKTFTLTLIQFLALWGTREISGFVVKRIWRKGNKTDLSASEYQAFTRAVNWLHYTAVMSLSGLVFYATCLIWWRNGWFDDTSNYNILLSVSSVLVALYIEELLTVTCTWMSTIHHLLTALSCIFLMDWTYSPIELQLGTIIMAYAISETNIYASLFIHELARRFPERKDLALFSRIATRVSVWVQICAIPINQVCLFVRLLSAWNMVNLVRAL